ncbi:MAG: polyphosphate polymerase domain-containing protein [Bacteroidales bacterium]|nr:polyphosphate polymerase domain-containing protein [Bacteroidales bacterium]
MKILFDILNNFSSVSLKEIEKFSLMNRMDTKFILPVSKIPALLEKSKINYKVLEINNKHCLRYFSTYFDTNDFIMYHSHHNGKLNRYKIRKREYLDTNTGFLEIKIKSNKGNTKKIRIKNQSNNATDDFLTEEIDFINNNTPFTTKDLVATMSSNFKRITLIHNFNKERITIDFDLEFKNQQKSNKLPYLAIAEIKQERSSVSSDFKKYLRQENVFPSSMSKYCIGSILLYNKLKYNNFKSKLRTIKKLNYDFEFNNVNNRY